MDENAFARLLKWAIKVILLLTLRITSVLIDCVTVITILIIRLNQPISAYRNTFIQRPNGMLLFVSNVTDAFELFGIKYKVKFIQAREADFLPFRSNVKTHASSLFDAETLNELKSRFTLITDTIWTKTIRTLATCALIWARTVLTEIANFEAWLTFGRNCGYWLT